MQLGKWNPFRRLRARKAGRETRPMVDPIGRMIGFGPSVEVMDEGDSLRVVADVPGLAQDELEVTIDERVVYLRGERQREETVEEEGYARTERYYGHFSRAIPLSADVDADGAEAELHDGVLTLRLPKRRGRSTPIEA